jgi:hypothetical protein
MRDKEPENNNLISFIATTVETMCDQMATKSDLAQLEDRLSTLNEPCGRGSIILKLK